MTNKKKSKRGGARVGAGRPTKVNELALVEQLSVFDETAQAKLFELIKGGNMKALQLFYAYRYGKPKETKDVKIVSEQPLFEISYDAIVEDIIEDTDE